MNFQPLPREFYLPSARIVAPRLLGHWLIRKTPEGICGGPIVETEAYLANDPACHGAVGETARNRAMWGAPGRSYVYFIYGCHFCFNAVCRPSGFAEAVLVRAIEPVFGETFMRARRPVQNIHQLTSGPAKLSAAMYITRTLDDVDLCDANSALFIAENPQLKEFVSERGPKIKTTRVGISKAADLPLRFYLSVSPFVSRRVAPPRRVVSAAK
ncbi:MAG: DNA-3-methyladenine glycosylase [Verrucomicrobiota bacterium]